MTYKLTDFQADVNEELNELACLLGNIPDKAYELIRDPVTAAEYFDMFTTSPIGLSGVTDLIIMTGSIK